MMKKILNYSILTIIITCFSFSLLGMIPIEGGTDSTTLSMDFENLDKLPDRLRMTTDLSMVVKGGGNTTGLENLNISGSSQFTSLSLKNLKKAINTKNKFWDIDLRQESHGFVNGNALSWLTSTGEGNLGLTYTEVIEKEARQLASIPFGKTLTLNEGKHTLIPTVIENESKLVSSSKLNYLRLSVTDNDRPTDETVDHFIQFINSLPQEYWLHFHCKAGDGRTTTFMAMFDMMKNSKSVSFEDIIQRQILLGGENLIIPNKEDRRSQFIINFYNYTKENKDGFATSWSSYIKDNNIVPFAATNELHKE